MIKPYPSDINTHHNKIDQIVEEPIVFYPTQIKGALKKRTNWIWAYYEFRGERFEISYKYLSIP